MKHLLNNLSESEKNRILSQYNNSLSVDTSKFKKLLESKLGNVKPLLTEEKDTTSCLPKLYNSKNKPGYQYYTYTNPNGSTFFYYSTGAYYIQKKDGSVLPKGSATYYGFYCEGRSIKTTTEIVTIDGPIEKVPFKDNVEGNKFRAWVNQKYPAIAKELDLDKTGTQYNSFNNEYITKAWNYKVGGKSLSQLYNMIETDPVMLTKDKTGKSAKDEYTKYRESEFDPYGDKASTKRSIELAPAKDIPQVIKGADRMNREIYYIKSRPEYKFMPFFVVDPRMKLVALFDWTHNFVRLSQTVEGENKQLLKPLTYKEWCESIPAKFENGKCSKDLGAHYDVLDKIDKKASSPGIYKTDSFYYNPGYLGQKGVSNTVGLTTTSGTRLPMAIHSLVNIPNRVTADAELKKYLGNAQTKGEVPKQYIDLVNRMMSSGTYDLSSGCFNVDPAFMEDSKVQEVLKGKPYVFVMSETEDYYLVKVEPEKSADFFFGLNGDDGFCKKPSSVASEVGGEGIRTA